MAFFFFFFFFFFMTCTPPAGWSLLRVVVASATSNGLCLRIASETIHSARVTGHVRVIKISSKKSERFVVKEKGEKSKLQMATCYFLTYKNCHRFGN